MKRSDYSSECRREKPALTPEERQMRCEMLAYNRAEEKLADGTASTPLILHFLKLTTEREKLERAKLEAEVELSKAKIEAMASQQRDEEKTERVLAALRRYQGSTYVED